MKKRTCYCCQNCSYETFKWVGKCPECQSWNSFEETSILATKKSSASLKAKESVARKINEIHDSHNLRTKTGIGEFDRVMGGGLVNGSLTLIGGEPGVGKSTLLTHVIGKLAQLNKNETILYVSAEESVEQIAQRAQRLALSADNIYLLNETSWQKIEQHIDKLKPGLLVIDSIQTILTHELQASAGSVSQVREVTNCILNYSKPRGISCFVVGHINKDGQIAGPKVLEHMVDTVVYFEGDQYGEYRMLRSIKNRFGRTNEVGIFEMSENGLKEVSHPSKYFLGNRINESAGRSLSCVQEGSRVLMIEVQALAVENKYGQGRRTTQGIEVNQLNMVLAIMEKHLEMSLASKDIYLNIAGGLKLNTRDIDLSLIASIYSSLKEKKIKGDTVFIGEAGLCGEIRDVPRIESRIKEAQQLNYQMLITSKNIADKYKNSLSMKMIGIKSLNELPMFI